MSVRFLGLAALIVGVVQLVGALVRLRATHAWSTVLGGALLAVLGVLILRNTLAAALTLTLAAAALFLASGVIRIGMAFAVPENRWGLLISGITSAVLGVIVLFNIVTATFTLLGVLLGVQVLLDEYVDPVTRSSGVGHGSRCRAVCVMLMPAAARREGASGRS